MTNINPVEVGLPSKSVKSLGELYLGLVSKQPSKKINFSRNRWYNIPYNENGRRAPITIHQVPDGRGGLKEVALFTNNISSANRRPRSEKLGPNNARKKALNLQNELAKNNSKTRKRKYNSKTRKRKHII